MRERGTRRAGVDEASSNPQHMSAHGSPGSCCPRKARAATVRLDKCLTMLTGVNENALALRQGLRCSRVCVRSMLPELQRYGLGLCCWLFDLLLGQLYVRFQCLRVSMARYSLHVTSVAAEQAD
jgi:hypothetical protein